MPSQKLSLEKGTPPRLELRWKGLWKDYEVIFDGRRLGGFADKRALQTGADFPLADGSMLSVKLASKKLGGSELEVLRNGKPLPGSAADPEQRLQVAYGIIFFVAGVSFALGLIAKLTGSAFLQQIGAVPAMIVQGCVYGALGYWVMQRRSVVALGLAVALFILDAVVSAVQGSSAGVITRLFLLLPMLGGFGALKQLRAQGPARPSK
jgi:hypothetical protein